MRERFDLVIVDPPPLETHREVLAMVKALPEVLLVSRCRRTSRHRTRLALRDLAWMQARVLGQVLNRRVYPFSL
jgi:Mrp family chromosome partitioning ATPase